MSSTLQTESSNDERGVYNSETGVSACRKLLRYAWSLKFMASDLPLFIVEMYTAGEIVEARKPLGAETAADVLLAAKEWISDSRHNATNFRVVDFRRDCIESFVQFTKYGPDSPFGGVEVLLPAKEPEI